MTAKHHYVSKFHLNQFLDPSSVTSRSPWLWLGLLPDGPVKKRAPKNVGTKRLLFDGPGGLDDRSATLEAFLAKLESTAADDIREVGRRGHGRGGEIPPGLARYLAWAAARSLPMRQLFHEWGAMHNLITGQVVEPPPAGLLNAQSTPRDISMVHPRLGKKIFPPDADCEGLVAQGWHPDFNDPVNFIEAVHVQAYYFQARFFTRLQWFSLHAPEGEFFVIGDRAVGWIVDGFVNAPPSSLRSPSAYVLAPLTKALTLVGRHTTDSWQVTPWQVNQQIAALAHEWIAGPSRQCVDAALMARKAAFAAV